MKYVREAGLPTTLSEENADEGRLEELAAKCTMDGPVGGLEKLGKEDVVRILNLAR
ncbi:iron-containing alcohol dehydrogenase [Enterocloster citroniae]|nr:iron-containing alcohol dehydrogenase [Enterocloster citroniae]MBS1482834.1 hypothetical protein [Clostridium sp.]MBT9811111.1 hypothetical protein [Enterocloster citroniae]MCB7064959.1 hypothetical protein [Enterocloster citroniae]MCC8082791.1 hypothetical protein [Clostridium sp.]MCD8277733.1 hypothetical protein [Enterocloster citroniae]